MAASRDQAENACELLASPRPPEGQPVVAGSVSERERGETGEKPQGSQAVGLLRAQVW